MRFTPISIKHSSAVAALCCSLVVTAGCGGKAAVDEELQNPQQPAVSPKPVANAGADLTVLNSAVVQLDGTASQVVEGAAGPLSFQWRQVDGPEVQFLTAMDVQSATPRMVTPSVADAATLEFELLVAQGDITATDRLLVNVEPCTQAAGEVYGDCIASGFGPFAAYESHPERGELHHFEPIGGYHVQWQTLDGGHAEHGEVVEVTWNANDPEHLSAANGWFGISVGELDTTRGADLSQYAQGTLSFDMRLVYHEQPNNAAPLVVKMECGWPCSSAELPIPGAESSYEWQTYSYSMARLVDSGLDISNVTFALVVQPMWREQEQTVILQIDNVRLTEEYTRPPPQDGCPKSGAISYTLARAADPTADQQDAYERIARAMDEAVRQYNCYTNLQRAMNVSYNPDVATADGNPNGSIRFGSRASMHHVTAMHEISHVLGVGAGPFRNLVREGVYTGAAGNAQLREISGVADDVIKSDGTHFWPHGLNYISEGETQEDLINHCLVVEAIVADL